MLSMSINHPDVEEFITKKQDLTKVTGANISVKVSDKFMIAVENDNDYLLKYPVDTIVIGKEQSILDRLEYNVLTNTGKGIYCKKVRARDLWNKLIHCAWNTAEPGIIFEDRMINYSPDGNYDDYKVISTNPCSEIGMGAYDSCRLLHLNLSSYVVNPFEENSYINELLLYKHSYEAMRLADDLVDLEVEAIDRILDAVKDDEDEHSIWSKIKVIAENGRRVGVGFTGLADTLAMLNLKYDSEGAIYKTSNIMRTIFTAQLDCQIDMAIERGTFPSFNKYNEWLDMGDILYHTNSWYEYLLFDYPLISEKMYKFGRRNISWSTVAPTGTVSIMAQCSSGIEPVFMPYYQRKKKCVSPEDRVDYTDVNGDNYTLFTVIHPGLKKWMKEYLGKADTEINSANLGIIEGIYQQSPYYKSTAQDINWEYRVNLQSIVQKYTTHSISSTINLPNSADEELISSIYTTSWKLGLKGITVYRDLCREGVLTSISTSSKSSAPKRPKDLEADCYILKSRGEQYIVLVGLLEGNPYEIFALRPKNKVNIPLHRGVITKKGKMKYYFNSDYISNLDILYSSNISIEEKAATLYSSMLLRHGVDINYIIKTARKVNDNIVSFSSAMCRVLSKYTKNSEVKDEVCPECGGTLTRSGGCISCLNCGYSKCS